MKSRWLLAVLAVLVAHSAIAAEAKKVLVIYPNSRLLPANIAFDSGLHQATAASPGQPIEVFSEFLDEPQFAGDRYELTVSTYLHEKYADRPPDAILVGGGDGLRFVLRYRDRLFPAVPVVHAAVPRSTLQSIPTLPPDVVGVPIAYDSERLETVGPASG